jgi:hypothetical protein
MKTPYCEIICSHKTAEDIGLRRSGWQLTKAGLGFETWMLTNKSEKMKTEISIDWKRCLIGFSFGKLEGLTTHYCGVNLGPVVLIVEWNIDPMMALIEK